MLLTALLIQIVAWIIGVSFSYTCNLSYSEEPLRAALYYGTVGPLIMMFFNAPLTLLVLALLSLLAWPGLRWRRARFLWVLGFMLWGAWWVTIASILCAD